MKFTNIVLAAVLLLAAVSCRVGTPVSNAHAQLDRRAPLNREDVVESTKPSDNEIRLTRTFAASRATVFAALTQAEHLANWLKPTDMALVTCEVDLRVGGTFRYVFQRPSGFKIEVRGLYEAIDPPRRIVYTETYDFSPLKVLVTTDLDVTDDKTNFIQTLRYSSKQERDQDFDSVATSATEAFAKLERYLGQISVRRLDF